MTKLSHWVIHRSAINQLLFNQRFYLMLGLLLSVLLTGCQFVSQYDEQTDKAVTQLQKDFETFFITAEQQAGSAECAYSNHIGFYTSSRVSVSSIDIRAKVIPKNDITIEQISLLKSSLETLEKLHKLDCLGVEQIISLRVSFNSIFTAILKFELAKKRSGKTK